MSYSGKILQNILMAWQPIAVEMMTDKIGRDYSRYWLIKRYLKCLNMLINTKFLRSLYACTDSEMPTRRL